MLLLFCSMGFKERFWNQMDWQMEKLTKTMGKRGELIHDDYKKFRNNISKETKSKT